MFKEKLRILKSNMKEWIKINYGDLETKCFEIKTKIMTLDLKVEQHDLSVEEVAKKGDLTRDLRRWMYRHESLLAQKARVT